jgi:hypothetical protein
VQWDENAVYMLIKCYNIRKCGKQLLSGKFVTVNEELAYKKIIYYTSAAEAKNKEIYLHKVRGKGKN